MMEDRLNFSTKLVILIEGAIIAALAMALSFIPIELPNAAFDLSLGMIPLVLYALRRGTIPGVTAGLIWGLLHLVLGRAYILTVFQAFFEYPFAFAFAGFAGLFSKKLQRALSADHSKGRVIGTVCLASFVAAFARWFWHYWAGVFIWGEYAPEGTSPYVYSLIMNGASAVANTLMLMIILSILVSAAKVLFKPDFVR
jgi:thiamine transporter